MQKGHPDLIRCRQSPPVNQEANSKRKLYWEKPEYKRGKNSFYILSPIAHADVSLNFSICIILEISLTDFNLA